MVVQTMNCQGTSQTALVMFDDHRQVARSLRPLEDFQMAIPEELPPTTLMTIGIYSQMFRELLGAAQIVSSEGSSLAAHMMIGVDLVAWKTDVWLATARMTTSVCLLVAPRH
jgi:hypothetical protein